MLPRPRQVAEPWPESRPPSTAGALRAKRLPGAEAAPVERPAPGRPEPADAHKQAAAWGPESERPNAGSRPAGCRERARARAAAQPWQPQEEDSGGRRLGRGVSRIRYGLKAWNLFQNRSSGAVLTSRGRRGQNSATVKKAPLLFLWHGRAGDLRQIRTKPSMRSTTQAPGPTP